MKLLKSKKLSLPKVYFVSNRAEISEIPPGVPFIYGDEENEGYLIRILEYEVLYQQAIKSGYPFNFKQILKDNGFIDLIDWEHGDSTYMEYTSEGIDTPGEKLTELKTINSSRELLSEFIKDTTAYVDIDLLKGLNVFPVWLTTIEEAVHTNIHNFAMFNSNMYNKKLEGMYGGIDLVSPSKNLIIIDISGSIPRAVSSTCLTLAKNLAETFYADLVITGSKSTLYTYEELGNLDINSIYKSNGMNNDQVYFKQLVTEVERNYKTAIVFGDDDAPGRRWSVDEYLYKEGEILDEPRTISIKEGKEFCKWKIEKLISFHTKNVSGKHSYYNSWEGNVAGYADWFDVTEIEHIKNWVKYLK